MNAGGHNRYFLAKSQSRKGKWGKIDSGGVWRRMLLMSRVEGGLSSAGTDVRKVLLFICAHVY